MAIVHCFATPAVLRYSGLLNNMLSLVLNKITLLLTQFRDLLFEAMGTRLVDARRGWIPIVGLADVSRFPGYEDTAT